MNTYKALLTIFSPDRVGLISDVTGFLSGQGINLGDTSFAGLGEGGGLTSLLEIPEELTESAVTEELRTLASLEHAEIDIKRLSLPDLELPSRDITHIVLLDGLDQPGLLARFTEVISEFGGNIVRLKSEQVEKGGETHFVTELALYLPPNRSENCLTALGNTAERLGQFIQHEAI
ncbi:glycine cleavage system protein R [Sneathiella limimaris]|uniref:glycine cleavage system protein R n=1 Tax=Sneathiella limimaris TaxID=1964213 RepID=UPI00146BEA9F|nr:ACT domain-containing protein [Sneathiella limimaris]